MSRVEDLEKNLAKSTELATKYRRQAISLKKQIEIEKANDLLQTVLESGLSIEEAKKVIKDTPPTSETTNISEG